MTQLPFPKAPLTPQHHYTNGALMRLTINLDDDLYAMARSHAIATKTSICKAIGDLLRRRTSALPVASTLATGVHPLSGFPVSAGNARTITDLDIRRSMDDDLFASMESMGYSKSEIQEALK